MEKMTNQEMAIKYKPHPLQAVNELRYLQIEEYGPSVYFLLHKGEVVYVGQSVSVPSRVWQHTKDKVFDSAFFINVNKDDMDIIEHHFIYFFKPKYNGRCGKEKFNTNIPYFIADCNFSALCRLGVIKNEFFYPDESGILSSINDDFIYDEEQAAQALNITNNELMEAIRKRKITCSKPGRKYRFKGSWLKEYFIANERFNVAEDVVIHTQDISYLLEETEEESEQIHRRQLDAIREYRKASKYDINGELKKSDTL